MSPRLAGLLLAVAIVAGVVWLARSPAPRDTPPPQGQARTTTPKEIPLTEGPDDGPPVTSTEMLRGRWAVVPLDVSLRELDAVWADRSAPLRAAMAGYDAPADATVHLFLTGPLDAGSLELAVPIGSDEGEKRALGDGLTVRTFEGGDAFQTVQTGNALRGLLQRMDNRLRLAAASDGSPADGPIFAAISQSGDGFDVRAVISLMEQ